MPIMVAASSKEKAARGRGRGGGYGKGALLGKQERIRPRFEVAELRLPLQRESVGGPIGALIARALRSHAAHPLHEAVESLAGDRAEQRRFHLVANLKGGFFEV